MDVEGRFDISQTPRDEQTGLKVAPSDSEWVAKYRTHLRATKSGKTVSNYTWAARGFETYLESQGHTIAEGPPTALVDYVVWLIDEKSSSPRSVATMVAGIKNYLHWLSGRLSITDYRKPNLPRIYSKKEYTPEKAEIDRYEKAVRITITKEPARTVLLLLPHCGLRIGEICKLTLKESINKRKIGDRIWTTFTAVTKGGDEKELPLMPPGELVLNGYLFGWRSQVEKNSKWLFPGNGIASVRPDTVRKYLNEVRKLIGSPGLSPHAIRRFFATYQHFVKGNDVSTVSKMLGHKTTKTTELYYINPTTMQVLKNIKT